MNIVGAFKGMAILFGKHKSAILGGCAIASAAGTVVLTVKATVKSLKKIDEMKEAQPVVTDEEGNEKKQALDKLDVLKGVWQYYIPTAVGFVTTTACIVCAHRIDAKRIATATSALLLSEKMNKELEKGITKEQGAEKLNEIKDRIFGKDPELKKAYANDGVIRKEMGVPNPSYPTFHDEQAWFKDELTGRTFRASRLEIEKAILDATREAISGSGIVELNNFFDFLGLETCVLGEMMCWDLQNQQFEIGSYEPDLMENGSPGLVIHWMSKPAFV